MLMVPAIVLLLLTGRYSKAVEFGVSGCSKQKRWMDCSALTLCQCSAGGDVLYNNIVDYDVVVGKKYARLIMVRISSAFVPLSTQHTPASVCPLLQEPRPIRKDELCRWLIKTDIRVSACFSMDMQTSGFFANLSKGGIQSPCTGPETATGSGSGSEFGSNSSRDLSSRDPPHVLYDGVPETGAGLNTSAPRICWHRHSSGTLEAPPPPGPMSQKFAAKLVPDLNLMMHAIQR